MEILTRKSDPKYDEDLVNKRYIDRKISEINLDSVPVGLGGWYPSNPIPNGWLLCDGRAISRTTYSALFAILGTTHGSGDGSTTFNIPNIKGRTIVGRDSADADFDTLGETRGAKTHTLDLTQIPSHIHDISMRAGGNGGWTTTQMSDGAGQYTGYTGSAGGGQAHNNLQPYIVENYIIKAFVVSNTPLQDNQVTIFNDMINALNSKFIGTSLYDVPAGSTGTITLSETSANFDFIEIYYMNNNGICRDYSKFYKPNGSSISLTSFENANLRNSIYALSGTTITFTSGRYYEITTGTSLSGNYLKITKVIGYKY